MTQVKQLARLGLFDAKVPRYTSYPTAPHFSTSIQVQKNKDWLGKIDSDSSVSMYVHVPFCKRLCWFCACRTQGVQSDEPVISYLGTLRDEIRMVAASLQDGVKLSRLHWGGGTPTIMPPEEIERLADTIARELPLAPGAEFSVEIDPTEVDDGRLDAFARTGMNRASIGVQDFDEKIQKAIGREQSFEVTRDVSIELRKRGIHSLNMDVLYGLPFQDVQSIRETTEKVLELEPDRVALFGYAHVPWMSRRQTMIPEEHLPGGMERLDLSETARILFTDAGYSVIGIDHFAKVGDGLDTALKAGKLRRNFQGYTDDPAETLIGVGASAISRFRQGYVQNIAGTSAYLRQIREGSLASARGHEFHPEDLLRSRVIEELMCTFRVDLNAVERELSEVAVDLRPEMDLVHQKFAGFVELDGDVLSINEKGIVLVRMISREFDAYSVSETGHSMAI